MHQFSRDILLNVLPDKMPGFDVIDVGCGEGIVSRALAAAGARVVGIDPTHTLIAHADAAERAHPVGVAYRVDDGATLHTVADGSVDGVTAALSLNNIADLDAALRSVRRVLRPMDFSPSPCRIRALTPPVPRRSRRWAECDVSPATTSSKGSGDRRTRRAFAEPAITTAPSRHTSRRCWTTALRFKVSRSRPPATPYAPKPRIAWDCPRFCWSAPRCHS